MRKKAGFTLIELLVVIAIIAILAAILFPIFVRAKGAAQISKCLSNTKQIGAAMQMYLDDNNQRFPSCAEDWGSEVVVGKPAMFELLLKYSKTVIDRIPGAGAYQKAFRSVGVFACPVDAGLTWRGYGAVEKQPIWPYTGSSYQIYGIDQTDWEGNAGPKMAIISWTGLVTRTSTGKREGAPVSALRRPSTKPMCGDIGYWHAGDLLPDAQVARKNVLFCDGHAARVSYDTYVKGLIQKLGEW